MEWHTAEENPYLRARRWLRRDVPKEKVGDALRFVVKATTGLGG
ncbi:hypothetical protein [Actinocrispum sp. NPDC049592]